jgi:hypothetical protein
MAEEELKGGSNLKTTFLSRDTDYLLQRYFIKSAIAT